MKLKEYIVTHIPTGASSIHVGFEPSKLSPGQTSLVLLAGRYVPTLTWTPSSEWSVTELSEKERARIAKITNN